MNIHITNQILIVLGIAFNQSDSSGFSKAKPALSFPLDLNLYFLGLLESLFPYILPYTTTYVLVSKSPWNFFFFFSVAIL